MKGSRKGVTYRRSGQALVETAAGLVLMSMFFVALIMFALNIYSVMFNKAKLEIVAAEVAKTYLGQQYFLGMERTDYDPGKTAARAEQLAEDLCDELGIPQLTEAPSFKQKTASDGSVYVVCEITSGIKIPYTNSMFPALVNLKATGVATDNGMAMHPPAVCNFQAYDQKTGTAIGCQFPAYGLTKNGTIDPAHFVSPNPKGVKGPFSYVGFSAVSGVVPMAGPDNTYNYTNFDGNGKEETSRRGRL